MGSITTLALTILLAFATTGRAKPPYASAWERLGDDLHNGRMGPVL